jgi:hypothetical protein
MAGRGGRDSRGARRAPDVMCGQSRNRAQRTAAAPQVDDKGDEQEDRECEPADEPVHRSRAAVPQSSVKGSPSGTRATTSERRESPSISGRTGSVSVARMQQMRARHREAQARYRQKHKVSTEYSTIQPLCRPTHLYSCTDMFQKSFRLSNISCAINVVF